MKIWIVIQNILFGIAKLAGAVIILGFSLGVIVGRKLKPDAEVSVEDETSATKDMAQDMIKAIEDAGKQVIKDLEERTMIAVKLLDEAEGEIARLKDMLDVCEEQVVEEYVFSEKWLEDDENAQEVPAEETQETATHEEVSDDNVSQVKRDLVFQLANEGLSVQEIAREVKIGCGEAELILKLRGNDD